MTNLVDVAIWSGMFITPSVFADLVKSTKMRASTMQGNSRINPNGTVMGESPVIRMGRAKKDVLGGGFPSRRGELEGFCGLSFEFGTLLVTSIAPCCRAHWLAPLRAKMETLVTMMPCMRVSLGRTNVAAKARGCEILQQ